MFDLIIKKGMAVLPDAVEMVDIAVKNGVIAAMAASGIPPPSSRGTILTQPSSVRVMMMSMLSAAERLPLSVMVSRPSV